MKKKSNHTNKAFKKVKNLELVLKELNNELKDSFSNDFSLPKKPIILIMGCARSGSTLLLQFLAESGLFSYPTNLIARFYKNPYLGIKVQQALLDFDPLNQIGFNLDEKKFDSNLGKTIGALAPSEFWYFWREYFNFSKSNFNYLDKNELSKIDVNEFLKKVAAFETLTSKPLVMKGMMLNWNIPFLHSIYDKFIFINLKREPLSNANSLINAREKYFSDKEVWYSFKPKEFEILKKEPYQKQVVGQVYYTNKAVDDGLKNVPASNVIDITYEKFCNNPYCIIENLKEKYTALGFTLDSNLMSEKFKEKSFNKSNTINLSETEIKVMEDYLKIISK